MDAKIVCLRERSLLEEVRLQNPGTVVCGVELQSIGVKFYFKLRHVHMTISANIISRHLCKSIPKQIHFSASSPSFTLGIGNNARCWIAENSAHLYIQIRPLLQIVGRAGGRQEHAAIS